MGIPEYLILAPLGLALTWSLYYISLACKGALLGARTPEAVALPSAPSLLPLVSLVIPAKDEGVVLEEAILQALSFTYPEGRKEIVIVEDGSNDATPEICRKYASRYREITLVQGGDSRGKPAALNRAMPHLRGEIIAFLDADARAHPDLLQRAVHFLQQHPDVDALQAIPQTLQGNENLITRLDSMETAFWYGAVQRAKDALGLFVHMCGSGMFIRRSTFDDLGTWDDRCLGEDVEYSTRLARAGRGLRLVPIKVWRQPPYSARAFLRQRMRWWGGVLQILGKNLRPRPAESKGRGMALGKRIDMFVHLFSPLVLLAASLALVFYLATLLFRYSEVLVQRELLLGALFTNVVLALVALGNAWAKRDVHGLALWPGMYYYWALQITAILVVLLRLLRGKGLEWERTEKRGVVWEA